MRRGRARWLAAGLLCAAAVLPVGARDAAPSLPAVGTVHVLFPPWDDAESALVAAVEAARTQVLVQAFLLTSRTIAASLIAARRRGIDVRVLADARQHAQHRDRCWPRCRRPAFRSASRPASGTPTTR